MRILLASLPADGHVNPLTAAAVHLRAEGHDVRWYTGPSYAEKIERLGVTHLPFRRAVDVNGENIAEVFPEMATMKGPKLLSYTLEKIFFENVEAHYQDIMEIRAEGFAFDAMLVDGAMYGTQLIKEKHGIPWFVVMAAPTPTAKSPDVPPPFFGLKPAAWPWRWFRDTVVDAMVESPQKGGQQMFNAVRSRLGLPAYEDSISNIHATKADKVFQVGTKSMDFPRRAWPDNYVHVGALLPARGQADGASPSLPRAIQDKRAAHRDLIVVSQGTIDNRDPDKLFIPALRAFAEDKPGPDTPLVVVTTGGLHTEALRRDFPQPNVVIEDFVDYGALMPAASVFITNGGMGSVLSALAQGVLLVTAGEREGKNDINARLSYCKLSVDVGTEWPSPKKLAASVDRVLTDAAYRNNVDRIRRELEQHDACALIADALRGRVLVEPAASAA